MTAPYTTSEEHLPDETGGEITMQVTDTETKEIFSTRARVARSAEKLDDPESLTVVRGPHESVEEQWYIQILETNVNSNDVDRDLLRKCIAESEEDSNVINARSDDLRAILLYLVESGKYDSVSDAVRAILEEYFAAEFPDLVDEYVAVQAERERDELASRLGGDEHR